MVQGRLIAQLVKEKDIFIVLHVVEREFLLAKVVVAMEIQIVHRVKNIKY